jgi:radical SAM/Cys-rich protein
MNEFDLQIKDATGGDLQSEDISIVQVNVGLICNQECMHCHLAASPKRGEIMSWETMEDVLRVAKETQCEMVDITGGSPELNPNFRRFVEDLDAGGFKMQSRTNLTVFLEPDMEDMPAFMKQHSVRLVGSLPCYLEENVRKQRGVGVYEKSIEAIKKLNEIGYGVDTKLPLNLVYNPVGPYLPPNQSSLEADYRRELNVRFGIHFTNLLTITNMPIGRFMGDLRRQKQDDIYWRLLLDNFNPQTVDRLMCRHQISIDWNGRLYDCDFNLALNLPVNHGAQTHINDFDRNMLSRRRIVTGKHCFGCTAGCGSSCGGALA